MIQFFVMPIPPLAFHDRSFLESTDARPIRILAEYLDPLRRCLSHRPGEHRDRQWNAAKQPAETLEPEHATPL